MQNVTGTAPLAAPRQAPLAADAAPQVEAAAATIGAELQPAVQTQDALQPSGVTRPSTLSLPGGDDGSILSVGVTSTGTGKGTTGTRRT